MMEIQVVVSALGTVAKSLWKKIEGIENGRKNRDRTHSSIVKIDQNTEKSPFTKTPVKKKTMNKHVMKNRKFLPFELRSCL